MYYKETVTPPPVDPVDPTRPPDQPETEIPGEGVPLDPQPEVPQPDDDIIIVDPQVPMGNLPQTGTATGVNPAVTLGLSALTLSLAMAGLAICLKKSREEEV